MEFIKAVIVDDEQSNIDVLKHDLGLHCPTVLILDSFTNPKEAIKYLSENEVDVVFLDISMPTMTGFEFLAAQQKINCQVIFVTAHQDYALAAFDFYALDYLLKPVSKEKLIRAVERIKIASKNDDLNRIEMLLSNYKSAENITIALPTFEGYEIVAQNQIIYLVADGNYTEIFLKENRKLLITKTLKEFERLLPNNLFTRIHHSYMIQNGSIKRYIKGDGGEVVLANGVKLPVSRANKLKLLNVLGL